MGSGSSKAIGALVVIVLVIGGKFGCRAQASHDVRKALYERYSEYGTPEQVKAVVDEYHDEAFERYYKMGGRRQSDSFDAEAYARDMDRQVLPRLQAEANRVDGESQARTTDAARQGRARAAQAAPTPMPPAGPHRVEVQDLALSAMTPEELRGVAMRGFHVRATVFDEADDVLDSPPPQGFMVVDCGGRKLERATSMPRVHASGLHQSVVETTFSLPPDEGTRLGCSAEFTLTDAAGNRSTPITRVLPAS